MRDSNWKRIFLCVLVGGVAFAQDGKPDVRSTFQSFLERHSASAAGSLSDESSVLGDRITAASPEDIAKSLPLMIGAAVSGIDDVLTRYGVMGLLAVGLRPDGAALLKEYMPAIASLLDSHDAPTERVAVVIIGSVESRQRTPGARQALTAFLKRTDRDLRAQAGAISVLAKVAVDDDAVAAIDQFLARDLDSDTRVASLYGLTSPDLILHAKVIDRMITLLSDGDMAVKITAIDSLTRIGPQALLLAEPVLTKLAEDAASPEMLRSAAKTALGKIGHTPASPQ